MVREYLQTRLQISGQLSGQSMRWKLGHLANNMVKIHGVSLDLTVVYQNKGIDYGRFYKE